MTAPTVSVVLASFNGERFIEEQLRSFEAQTTPPFEVIISDDGSTDSTVEIAERFAKRAPFHVDVIRREHNSGYANNFLDAALCTRGQLVAFCDQDDVWLPNKLGRTASEFADPDVTQCVHEAQVVDRDLVVRRSLVPHFGLGTRSLLSGRLFAPHGSRTVIRRELLDVCPPHNRPRTMYTWGPTRAQEHDEWAFFAARSIGRVVFVREVLSLFRRHEAALGWYMDHGTDSRSWLLRSPSEQVLVNYVDACAGRAAYLRGRAAELTDTPLSHRLSHEADIYDCLRTAIERRRRTLKSGRLLQRAVALSRAALSGDYGPQRRGGLGWLALLQDAIGLVRSPENR